MNRVVIIGGGFSGTAVAIRLLQSIARAGTELRVTLVERTPVVGKGVAYGTRNPSFLLNVPAGRMSLFEDQPSHFLDWARARGFDQGPDAFLPRSLYGEYVVEQLERTLSALGPLREERFEVIRDEATRVSQSRSVPGGLEVELASGRALAADAVVQATGFTRPIGLFPALSHERYVRDPWTSAEWSLAAGEEDLALFIGSGLTMIDQALDFLERRPRAKAVAISRHGILPARHPHSHGSHPVDLGAVSGQRLTLRSLVRASRREARRLVAEGHDWVPVIDAVRARANELWASFSEAERQRFLRHVRSYWDPHRHRLPSEIDERLRAHLASGRLRLVAGRCRSLVPSGDQALELQVRSRGSAAPLTFAADWVIDCSGAHPNAHLPSVPHERIYRLGPPLRPKLWETTAVPEIRKQATELVRELIASLGSSRASSIEPGVMTHGQAHLDAPLG